MNMETSWYTKGLLVFLKTFKLTRIVVQIYIYAFFSNVFDNYIIFWRKRFLFMKSSKFKTSFLIMYKE